MGTIDRVFVPGYAVAPGQMGPQTLFDALRARSYSMHSEFDTFNDFADALVSISIEWVSDSNALVAMSSKGSFTVAELENYAVKTALRVAKWTWGRMHEAAGSR